MLSSQPIELQINAGPPHTVRAAPWLCIAAKRRTGIPALQCMKEKRNVLNLQRGPNLSSRFVQMPFSAAAPPCVLQHC